MQKLSLKLKCKQDAEMVSVEITSGLTVKLGDFSDLLTGLTDFLKKLERAQTGSTRAYRTWNFSEMNLIDIPDEEASSGVLD
jgi:hypothetical protein